MQTLIKQILPVLFLLILFPTEIYGQMAYIGLKEEGNVKNVSQEMLNGYNRYWCKPQLLDNYLYIPTINGLYRKDLTTLDNTDWELYAFEGLPISSFIKKNDTILAAVAVYSDKDLLLLSTDDGKSYRDYTHPHFFESSLLPSSTIYYLEQNPQNPNTILALSEYIGASISYDFGENWEPLDQYCGSFEPFLGYNPHDTTNIFCVTNYELGEFSLYSTYDNGNNWQRVNFNIPLLFGIAFHPADKNTMLYYGSTTFFKSTDQGLTWNETSSYFGSFKVLYDSENPDILYTADYTSTNDTIKIYRSTDGGDTWDLFYKEVIILSDGVVDLHLYNRKLIVYTAINGVYYLDLDNMPVAEYEYVPLVKEGAQWSYCRIFREGLSGQWQKGSHFYIYFEGDTIIHNISYKKLQSYSCKSGQTGYILAMREEAKVVYAVSRIYDSEDEVILYDYNLLVGDCYESVFGYGDCLELTQIDTIQVGNNLRKQFNFGGYKIIEGLGSVHQMLYLPFAIETLEDDHISLNHYKEDGVILYHTDEWFFSEEECPTVGLDKTAYSEKVLLTNPVSDRLEFDVELLDNPCRIEVINLQGQVVLQDIISKENGLVPVSNITNGLYIYRITNSGKTLYQGKFIRSNF